MAKKTVLLVAILSIATTINAQTYVYDAHGKQIGKYESNGAPLGGQAVNEAVIRQINGVWLALPVGPMGFVDNANAEPTQDNGFGVVYFTKPDCQGQPYLQPYSDDELPSPNVQPFPPFVENTIVVQQIAYYVQPSEYLQLVTSDPVTICSFQSTYVPGTWPDTQCSAEADYAPYLPSGCRELPNLLKAQSFPLSNLDFFPPFTLR